MNITPSFAVTVAIQIATIAAFIGGMWMAQKSIKEALSLVRKDMGGLFSRMVKAEIDISGFPAQVAESERTQERVRGLDHDLGAVRGDVERLEAVCQERHGAAAGG